MLSHQLKTRGDILYGMQSDWFKEEYILFSNSADNIRSYKEPTWLNLLQNLYMVVVIFPIGEQGADPVYYASPSHSAQAFAQPRRPEFALRDIRYAAICPPIKSRIV